MEGLDRGFLDRSVDALVRTDGPRVLWLGEIVLNPALVADAIQIHGHRDSVCVVHCGSSAGWRRPFNCRLYGVDGLCAANRNNRDLGSQSSAGCLRSWQRVRWVRPIITARRRIKPTTGIAKRSWRARPDRTERRAGRADKRPVSFFVLSPPTWGYLPLDRWADHDFAHVNLGWLFDRERDGTGDGVRRDRELIA